MFLHTLTLTHFRNFSQLSLTFAPITIILGDNAQGKSNLLEAIYYLALSKSPRVEKDIQLIQQSETVCRLEGELLATDNEITKLEIVMQLIPFENMEPTLEKRVRVNGLSKRVIDYIGNLVVIYFSPEDINLVTGAPALRRLHIDTILSQIDSSYKRALSVYGQAITSRNRVLKHIKEGIAQKTELDFWTDQVVEQGQIISEKRLEFFTFLNDSSGSLKDTVGSFGVNSYSYTQSLISHERLASYYPKEVAAATTLIGPHRDDFTFLLEGKNLTVFGSRGQQRMAVLDLKLLELEFIKQMKHLTPLLLLDDIFSELDEKRRANVMSVIHGYQTVLSVIEEESIPQFLSKEVSMFRVKEGELEEVYFPGSDLVSPK